VTHYCEHQYVPGAWPATLLILAKEKAPQPHQVEVVSVEATVQIVERASPRKKKPGPSVGTPLTYKQRIKRLLTKEMQTSKELAMRTKIQRRRVAEALNGLVKSGYAEQIKVLGSRGVFYRRK
jgi:predicted HTH transcriptional regulator